MRWRRSHAYTRAAPSRPTRTSAKVGDGVPRGALKFDWMERATPSRTARARSSSDAYEKCSMRRRAGTVPGRSRRTVSYASSASCTAASPIACVAMSSPASSARRVSAAISAARMRSTPCVCGSSPYAWLSAAPRLPSAPSAKSLRCDTRTRGERWRSAGAMASTESAKALGAGIIRKSSSGSARSRSARARSRA